MKSRIGVIGANGDLGSQLTQKLKDADFQVVEYIRSNHPTMSIDEMLQTCDIVHVCAPLCAVEGVRPSKAIVVLHDSVMNSSRTASRQYLHEDAAIVHMLMNEENTVVVATDTPHHDTLVAHIQEVGFSPRSMTIHEHDYLMARSQAPLALLCKALLPYLYEQADEGLLTASGQLLTKTLRSRELTWTDETMRSILANPELPRLIYDMSIALHENSPRDMQIQLTKTARETVAATF